jgi:WD40 repeat protein
MIRMIAECDPEKPSSRVYTLGLSSAKSNKRSTIASDRSTQFPALQRTIRGDLDWITLKCLEKDRNRRYASPSELAADIRRHINNEPVLAAAPSMAYRFSKFHARNRVGVAAAVTVALTLLTATIFSMRSARVARQHSDLQRQQIYALDMYRAHQFLREGSRKAAHDLLQEHTPAIGQRDLRGFEWEFLRSQLHESEQCLQTLEGSTDEIAASPGGRFIAYEDDSKDVVVVREQQPPYRIVKELPNPGVAIDFSHNDELLLVATGQNGLRVYRTEDWQPVLEKPNWTYPARFSRDGKFLAYTEYHDSKLRIARTRDWEEEFSVDLGQRGLGWWLRRHSIVFSPDSKYLIYPAKGVSKDGVHAYAFFDMKRREVDQRLNGLIPYSHTISMSPDGTTVATDDPEARKKIDVWDLTGDHPKKIHELRQHRFAVSRVQYTADGQYLVSISGDEQVVVWDAKTHTYSHSLWGHLDQLWALAVAPDSKTVFTGASREYPSIKVWNISPLPKRSPATGVILGFAGEDQELVTIDTNARIRRWDHRNQFTEVATIADDVGEVAKTHDTGAWSITSDGELLVVGFRDGQVKSWDIEQGRLLGSAVVVDGHTIGTVSAHPKLPHAVLVSTFHRERKSDGKNKDTCRVFIWDAVRHKPLHELPIQDQEIVRTAMSPDGKYVAINRFTTAQVFSVRDGERLFEYQVANPLWAHPAFSPDSSKLAIAPGSVIHVLDTQTGEKLHELRGHAMAVFSLNFSGDGNTLISANDSVKFWHLPTRTDVITLTGNGMHLSRLASTKHMHRLCVSSGWFSRKVETIEVPRELKR